MLHMAQGEKQRQPERGEGQQAFNGPESALPG